MAFDMAAMASAMAAEMLKSDGCAVGDGGANGRIERLADATETKSNFVGFPCRNASALGDAKWWWCWCWRW